MPRINKDICLASTYENPPYGSYTPYSIMFRAKEQKYYLETEYDSEELDQKTAQLISKLMRLSKEEGRRKIQDGLQSLLGLDE